MTLINDIGTLAHTMNDYIPEQVWRDRTAIEDVQLARLQTLLRTVGESNSFWQKRFQAANFDPASVSSLSDFQRLPVLFKQDLVDDQLANLPYGTNLTFDFSKYSRLHQTSGTTGRPLRWLDTADSWSWMGECWRQIYLFAGVTSDDVMFLPFSFGPFIGFWGAFDGACRMGNLCIAGGGMSTEVRLRVMAENSATVLCCTPTYALRMAEVAEAEGVDLASGSVRMLIVAGEPGGSIPATRKRIETAWGARVIDHWGMTEIGSPGVEAVDRPGGLYVLETEFIAEVVTPETYEPVEPGEQGELLITNLGRIGSPVIRYRTGDLVRAEVSAESNEVQLMWLEGGILGRADDMVTVRGNNVFPSSIEAILREFDDVAEFRINIETRREMNHLRIEVEPSESRQDGLDDLEQEIRKRLRNRLGFQCDLRLVDHGALPRFEMKGRRLHRQQSDDT
jgi:phenylacetate-CoA ligase